MSLVTITPTEERAVLRIKAGAVTRRGSGRLGDTMLRWLERAAKRKGRSINDPSLEMQVDYDPAQLGHGYLVAWVDSFPAWMPAWMPDWLRTTLVNANHN